MTKPRFSTKEECQAAISTNAKYLGCSPIFVSDHYAAAHGVVTGGWYFYSHSKNESAVR